MITLVTSYFLDWMYFYSISEVIFELFTAFYTV